MLSKMRTIFQVNFVIFITASAVVSDFPFRNVSLPWDVRVDDLVKRLTLNEVMFQMAKGGAGPKGGPAPAIERLNISPYQWSTECLRGDADAGKATAFPQALGLAAAFSPSLIRTIAEAVSIEVRAKNLDYTKHGDYGDHTGLSCFSPVINIMRHPLWGRSQETYGEDPYLTGVYAANFVQGLQGDDPRYIRANAGCKHFDVHGGPENIPQSRFSFDAKVSMRDWRLTFLPAFRSCVQAGTYSLMCSYNSINGVPSCANEMLLTDILRKEWGFTGYVVSDEVAIENIIYWHKYLNNSVDTVTACVNAGCNLELSWNNPQPVYLSIVDAVKQGKLSEDMVRERVKPLFYTRMRLGEFDPPAMNPYSQYNLSYIQSPEHRQLAVNAAMKTFVLLKNDNNLLPLVKTFGSISIVGPMADNLEQLFGDYHAQIDPWFSTTPLEGLSKLADKVIYAAGCNDNRCKEYSSGDIQNAVRGTQLVIVCLGTGDELESEGNDRSSMELPSNQTQLMYDVIKYSSGTPIILILFNAGPVNITLFDEDPRVPAILECFFPAQATGEALYNVLTNTGAGANPAARLPYTWYKTADQIPNMTDYTMTGRTYRYFIGDPLYPFGYGLSYAMFHYYYLSYPTSIEAGTPLVLNGMVDNIADFDGEEVVQVYIWWLNTQEQMPQRQLAGFDRFFIPKQTSLNFNFTIQPDTMAVWTDEKGFVIEPGTIGLSVGGQQPGQKKVVKSNVITGKFTVTGSKVLGRF
ncbi:hypothetical protein CHS0354_026642 [Potamilus streckersoni]|uniref:Fibronectin type III-like domain-containing protein n=1 Tax=Potamilus streckersoni TaxID=2493646 RepID=A0AAE0SZ58_9BIVA|nr:hypothetical protein CHS0354_026642 [Potamilus streckersoni]